MRGMLLPLMLGVTTLALTLGCSNAKPVDKTKTGADAAKPAVVNREPVFTKAAQGVVYVANAGDDTLWMFDRSTMTKMGDPVRSGTAPGNLAVDPKTGRVYFPARFKTLDEIEKSTEKDDTGKLKTPDQFRSMSFWAIDPTAGNQYAQKAFVGMSDNDPDPVFIALHPNVEWVAVSDAHNGKIEFKDQRPDGHKNASIAVGAGPNGGAFSPDAKWFVVANNDPAGSTDPDTVSIIDFLGGQTGPTEVAKVPVGVNPSQVVIAADSATAYVTVTGSNKVVALDLAGQTVKSEWTVPGMPQGIALDKAGTGLYVTLQDTNQLVRLNTVDGTVTMTVSLEKEPWMIALDESNNRVWVTNRGSNSISVVNLGTQAVESTIKTGKQPTGIVIVENPAAPQTAPQTAPVTTPAPEPAAAIEASTATATPDAGGATATAPGQTEPKEEPTKDGGSVDGTADGNTDGAVTDGTASGH